MVQIIYSLEPVGAIAETESIPKSIETPKKRGRRSKSKPAPVEDKFSDDEYVFSELCLLFIDFP